MKDFLIHFCGCWDEKISYPLSCVKHALNFLGDFLTIFEGPPVKNEEFVLYFRFYISIRPSKKTRRSMQRNFCGKKLSMVIVCIFTIYLESFVYIFSFLFFFNLGKCASTFIGQCSPTSYCMHNPTLWAPHVLLSSYDWARGTILH